MATPIPGYSPLERAEFTISIINGQLPTKGMIRQPKGRTEQVRWTLTHDSLLPLARISHQVACRMMKKHLFLSIYWIFLRVSPGQTALGARSLVFSPSARTCFPQT